MRLFDQNCQIVYIAMQRSDDSETADIIQLAAHSTNGTFSTWIEPSSRTVIPEGGINGFEYRDGEAFFRNRSVNTVPLKSALQAFLTILNLSPKVVLLVGRTSDCTLSPLLEAINRTNMMAQFSNIVVAVSSFDSVVDENVLYNSRLLELPLSVHERNMLESGDFGLFDDAAHYAQVLKQISNKFSLRSFFYENFTLYVDLMYAFADEMGEDILDRRVCSIF